MKNKTYERQVDALIPAAEKIANSSAAYIKARGMICQDDVWNREFHRAMDALKYENQLIGWKR